MSLLVGFKQHKKITGLYKVKREKKKKDGKKGKGMKKKKDKRGKKFYVLV